MPVRADYLTVAEFKTRVGRTASTPEEDAEIGQAIGSASRQVDNFCGRSFGQSDAPEARYFEAGPWSVGWSFSPYGTLVGGRGACFRVGDVVSVSEIASDDGTGGYLGVWDPGSYVLAPASAARKGWPYREVNPAPASAWWPPGAVTAYPLRVTGLWGWPAVPAPVREAAYLQANRLKSLWTAPFGVAGSGEMGQLQQAVALSPVLKEMLAAYRVMPV